MATYYDEPQPTRDDIDQKKGALLIEFGAHWCGYCQAMQPELAAALLQFTNVQHIKIEDGKGRPLGRSFRVKLWPTLVFMRDGEVRMQVARPARDQIDQGLAAIQ